LGSIFTNGYDSNIAAIYTEADLLFSKVGGKSWCSASNNDLLNETAISPEFLLHIKYSQFSFAYGDFTQTQVQITSNILTINLRARKHHIIF
jgi:hypothetical protein